MPNIVKRSWPGLAVVAAVLVTSAALGRSAASVPCSPPNVMSAPVCDMDSFHTSPAPGVGEVPDGWTEFILSGHPVYSAHDDTCWGPPSLMMRVFDEAFQAGIYTQVAVQPGAGYRASASWGAPNQPDAFGRQLGLDPTGGTDPTSADIIWGPIHWGEGRILNYPPPDVNIDVRARAISDTMTVFFYVDHIENPGDNLIFIDAISLYPDESAPPLPTPVGTLEPSSFLPLVAYRDGPAPQPTGTPMPSWSEPLRIAGNRETGVSALFGSQPAAVEGDDSLLIAYSLDHGDDGQSGEDEAYVRQNLAASGWQTPTVVSDVAAGASAGAPSLLLDAALRGHALWSVRTQGEDGLSFDYARRDSGSVWTAPEPAPALAGYRTVANGGTHHLVQVENDAIGVVWLGQTGSLSDVYWAARDATGWTAGATISHASGGLGASFPGVVRSSDATVHVLWHEDGGVTQSALREATTGAWTLPMTATQEAGLYYRMAPGENGDVHLLRQNELRLDYTYKDDESDWEEAFQEAETVVSETIGLDYGASSLAVDALGNPHAAWSSGTQLRYAAREPAAGWTSPITLFDRTDAHVTNLHLFADNSGGLHLLWREDGEIWYSTSSDTFR